MTIFKGLGEIAPLGDPVVEGVPQVVGQVAGEGMRVGIVASRFNSDLTHALVSSSVNALRSHGVAADHIHLSWVPGAYEIPTALEVVAGSNHFDALLAIGAVLEGDTPHATAISTAVSRSLTDIARRHQVPVIDGVVVARTMEQAVARCMSAEKSRGWYVALAALEMAHVIRSLKEL